MPHSSIVFSLSKQGSSRNTLRGLPNDFYRPLRAGRSSRCCSEYTDLRRDLESIPRPFLIAGDPKAPIPDKANAGANGARTSAQTGRWIFSSFPASCDFRVTRKLTPGTSTRATRSGSYGGSTIKVAGSRKVNRTILEQSRVPWIINGVVEKISERN